MHKVKCHPSLQKGGCHEAYDIEDLIKVGRVVKGFFVLKKNICFYSYVACQNLIEGYLYFPGCAYYAATSMADDAQLVFCPYSYIINPVIRRAMDVNIKGAIIVIDEAQYVFANFLNHFLINI